MSILVEHSRFYDSRQDKHICFDNCPRCAQDKIVALIKQKRVYQVGLGWGYFVSDNDLKEIGEA